MGLGHSKDEEIERRDNPGLGGGNVETEIKRQGDGYEAKRGNQEKKRKPFTRPRNITPRNIKRR